MELQEEIKKENSNVYASGDSITMHVTENLVFVNGVGIVFPFPNNKEYVLTVTIKPAHDKLFR